MANFRINDITSLVPVLYVLSLLSFFLLSTNETIHVFLGSTLILVAYVIVNNIIGFSISPDFFFHVLHHDFLTCNSNLLYGVVYGCNYSWWLATLYGIVQTMASCYGTNHCIPLAQTFLIQLLFLWGIPACMVVLYANPDDSPQTQVNQINQVAYLFLGFGACMSVVITILIRAAVFA